MRSLRSRLLLGVSFATLVVLASAAVLAYVLMRTALHRGLDAALTAQARATATLAVRDGNRLRVEFDAVQLPEYIRDERPDVFCFWDRNGQELLRSPALPSGGLPLVRASSEQPDIADHVLPDGRAVRVMTFSYSPRLIADQRSEPLRGRALTLAVARDTFERDQQLRQLALVLIASTLCGSLVACIGLWWWSRRLVQPLAELGNHIATITAERMTTRLGALPLPSELDPVRQRLDDLLDRLEAAFRRERSFTANAAHELRTPLSGLRTTLEVAVARERPAQDYRQALCEGLEISIQMQGLVDNLLALARVDAGQVGLDVESFDFTSLVEQCWSSVSERARQRDLHPRFDLGTVSAITADRGKLRLVLGNLFDNAVSYADQGGDIAVTAMSDGAMLTLTVDNSGCTLPASTADQVFAPFWRGDAAHSASGVHCGLGLALCQKLARVMRGNITAAPEHGRFRITLTIPVGG